MLKKMFDIVVKVATPTVIGQDDKVGRRQLIPITEGKLKGQDIAGNQIEGTVLPGGVDSQVIRPNGICELSARYGVCLSNGDSFYIENNGIRTVPDEYVEKVVNGEFVDPDAYYFSTTPTFEIYSDNLKWLNRYLFVCKATRLPKEVQLSFYIVEK